MVKLQEAKNQFFVTVPQMKVARKHWKKGQMLDWVEYPNGDLCLVEVKG